MRHGTKSCPVRFRDASFQSERLSMSAAKSIKWETWLPTATNALFLVIISYFMNNMSAEIRALRADQSMLLVRITDETVKNTETTASLQRDLDKHFQNLQGQVHEIAFQLTQLNERLVGTPVRPNTPRPR